VCVLGAAIDWQLLCGGKVAWPLVTWVCKHA